MQADNLYKKGEDGKYRPTPTQLSIDLTADLSLDWDKIHSIMKFRKWQYWWTEGVPTTDELKLSVADLIDDIINEDYNTSISGGGFKATKYRDIDEGDKISVEFIVAKADVSIPVKSHE